MNSGGKGFCGTTYGPRDEVLVETAQDPRTLSLPGFVPEDNPLKDGDRWLWSGTVARGDRDKLKDAPGVLAVYPNSRCGT
jgi:hypothetical protein